tara:strand:+ start:1509 stop:2255 length:747 start_codon:yes stop_codon:yes gene_type:complete
MSTYEQNRYAFPASAITSGTFANARLSSGSVTQHVDLTALSADNLTSGTVPSARLSLGASDIPDLATSKITSGTFADARISSSSVTQHASSVTNTSGTWTPGVVSGSVSVINGHYQRVGDMVLATAHMASTSNTGSSNSLWYFSGLPITSRNLGNSHRNAGMGHLICRGGGIGRLIVKSSSTVMYYINGGDVRNLSDMQGLATSGSQRSPSDTQHYATQNNFFNTSKGIYPWSTNTNAHYMLSITYLV